MEFDVIYNKDVLCHLYDPIGVFQTLNTKLKHDGILVFESGNGGELSRFWLNFLGKLSYPGTCIYIF